MSSAKSRKHYYNWRLGCQEYEVWLKDGNWFDYVWARPETLVAVLETYEPCKDWEFEVKKVGTHTFARRVDKFQRKASPKAYKFYQRFVGKGGGGYIVEERKGDL